MKLFNIPYKLTEDKLEILERQFFNENIQRCKLFAKIVILFELILIVMYTITGKGTFTIDFYLMMYFILLIAAVVMLLFMRWYEKETTRTKKQFNFYQKGLLGFVLFFLLWGTAISLADQKHYGNVMAFAVNIMCVSILFHASNRTILQLYVLPIAGLYIGLPFFQSSSTVLMGHYINLSVFLFFCWLASRMLYTSYYTNFYNKILLLEMNENLELKIQENEKINRELAKANHQLKELSLIDELTKVPNRREFQEYIQQSLSQINESRSLSIMMIDIDYFKLFNDHYGHLEGDKIIQSVAQVLKTYVDAANGLLARFGGEEFIIAVFDLEDIVVNELAENLRRAVFDLQLIHDPSLVSDYVTVSVGLASALVNNQSELEILIEKADHALYEAKAKGRNQVEKETDIFSIKS